MPSPFPGMDPYLEGPWYFPILHGNLIFVLQETLQSLLPEAYDAASNERTWIEYEDRTFIPDVNVVTANGKGKKRPARDGEAAVAVAEPNVEPDAGVRIVVAATERRERFLEIHVRKGGRLRLVTHIEVLSPSNKRSGHEARAAYLDKQRECLGAKVHLVEIDLLRQGLHTTAIRESSLRARIPEFDYHVCVHRYDEPGEFVVYPSRLPDALPKIPIPLLPGDGAVTIDLQEVFRRCYDVGPYRKRIDYKKDKPDVPLDRPQSAWARKVIARGQ